MPAAPGTARLAQTAEIAKAADFAALMQTLEIPATPEMLDLELRGSLYLSLAAMASDALAGTVYVAGPIVRQPGTVQSAEATLTTTEKGVTIERLQLVQTVVAIASMLLTLAVWAPVLSRSLE